MHWWHLPTAHWALAHLLSSLNPLTATLHSIVCPYCCPSYSSSSSSSSSSPSPSSSPSLSLHLSSPRSNPFVSFHFNLFHPIAISNLVNNTYSPLLLQSVCYHFSSSYSCLPFVHPAPTLGSNGLSYPIHHALTGTPTSCCFSTPTPLGNSPSYPSRREETRHGAATRSRDRSHPHRISPAKSPRWCLREQYRACPSHPA